MSEDDWNVTLSLNENINIILKVKKVNMMNMKMMNKILKKYFNKLVYF